MSHYHYTPKRSGLSMAELNQAKKQTLRLSMHLQSIFDKTNDDRYRSQAYRSRTCSTFWNGFYCEKCGKYHYMHTTGCRHRLCPICAVRASRVVACQALEAISWIKEHDNNVSFSLLTLTQKNVSGEALASTIDSMLAAWQTLRHLRAFGKEVTGWARTIEIVPALDGDGYHPHIHAIIIHKGMPRLSNGAWWSNAWRDCMKLDYNPIVDIRPISDEVGAVYEVSKYISKLSRIYDGTPAEEDRIFHIGNAMYNRQLRTYGGIWLKARRAVNMVRVEQMDDDTISTYGEMLQTTCAVCDSELVAVSLAWSGLTYKIGDMPAMGLKVGDMSD